MSDKKFTNTYDDGNIPDIDLPQDITENKAKDSKQIKNDVISSHPKTNNKKED
ncbi:MAG: hypothetical protein ACI4A3_10645 [Lachnospiraceae bacterium]